MKKLMIALCALTSVAAVAETEIESPEAAEQSVSYHWTPLEINLASPVVAFPWWERDVYGLKANLAYGDATCAYGVDCGVVSRNTGDTLGLQANVWNWDSGRMLGFQAGGLADIVLKGFAGIQCAGVLAYDLDRSEGLLVAPVALTTGFSGWEIACVNWELAMMDGFQLGVANAVTAEFRGLQLGCVNWSRRSFTGCQLGLINCIQGEATGAQIGVFNGADSLAGVQVGVFNFNATATLPLMILVNVGF